MSNPVLNKEYANRFASAENSLESMSIGAIAMKTLFLLAIVVAGGVYQYSLLLQGFSDKVMLLFNVGLWGGLITALFTTFTKNTKLIAPLSIVYAILEGLAIGGLSAFFVSSGGLGLVTNAACATFITLGVVLFLYSARIINYTQKFAAVVMSATFAIFVVYLVSLIVSFFNPAASSALMGSGTVGIGFSIFVCIVAALNFVIDFHIIEEYKSAGASKDFEWYGAFSLMVTIIWLYIEILRLLAKVNNR